MEINTENLDKIEKVVEINEKEETKTSNSSSEDDEIKSIKSIRSIKSIKSVLEKGSECCTVVSEPGQTNDDELMETPRSSTPQEENNLPPPPSPTPPENIEEIKYEKKAAIPQMSLEASKPSSGSIRISMASSFFRSRAQAKLDWFYILPIVYFCLPAFIFLLGAIASAYLIPVSADDFSTVSMGYQFTRLFALILDSIAIGITIYVLGIHCARFLNVVDAKLVKFYNEVLTMSTIFILVPFNILMIVAEVSMPQSYLYSKINEYAYMTSGILGLLAIVPLCGLLFYGKVYETFCIKLRPSTETTSQTTEI